MESPVQMGMLGANRIISSIAFYVRYLMIQLQFMLFLYTMSDKLDELTERREAFTKTKSSAMLPKDIIDVIFTLDSVGIKAMEGMIEVMETYEFPYYAENCAVEKELLQERMNETGGTSLLE